MATGAIAVIFWMGLILGLGPGKTVKDGIEKHSDEHQQIREILNERKK